MNTEKRVIALGFFDGLHIGHRALIEKTLERARARGCLPSIISFDSHPDQMVSGQSVELINSPFDRASLARSLFGIDDLIFLHFDQDLRHMPWEKFVEWLAFDWDAVELVAGYDFRFGYKGEGTAQLLLEKCQTLGIGCHIVPKVTLEGITVSSTYIRQLIRDGNMIRANQFLGHPHFFTDVVRNGFRFGRTMGVPTINMQFAPDVVVPAHGVYASRATLPDGRVYWAITNVGVRPTVSGGEKLSVESHLLGFSGNLYGKLVRIQFYKFLRPEKKFPDVDALKAQIRRDIEAVSQYFENQANL